MHTILGKTAQNTLHSQETLRTMIAYRRVNMLDYDEELKKFKPSLEVEDIEEAVYSEDLSDMTDLLREVMDQTNK